MSNITPDSPWWWGRDDERFFGPFDTREAAEEAARDDADDGFYICQAEKRERLRLSEFIDADRLIEMANEGAWEAFGDPEGDSELFDATKDQIADLGKRLKTAADEWQTAHGIVVSPFQFSISTNPEWVAIQRGDN